MVKLFQRTTPHPRLRHRRADAEHIRPAANPIQLGYHKTLQLRRISMKTKKRFFTLMLALALAVCMAVPAFASYSSTKPSGGSAGICCICKFLPTS